MIEIAKTKILRALAKLEKVHRIYFLAATVCKNKTKRVSETVKRISSNSIKLKYIQGKALDDQVGVFLGLKKRIMDNSNSKGTQKRKTMNNVRMWDLYNVPRIKKMKRKR